MKSEKLFDAITEIDEELIREADTEKIKIRSKRKIGWLSTAACGVIVIGAVLAVGFGTMGASAGGGMNREPGENYMAYAGPAFPLSAEGDISGLVFERETDFGFSPYYPWEESYTDSDGEEVFYETWNNDAVITDSYMIENTTDEDITFRAIYPFAGNINTALSRVPKISISGETIITDIAIGPYSGGFSPAWGDEGGSESLNLSSIESWYEYKVLLENGEYLEAAFDENPDMDIPVKVYSFDIEYNIPMEEFDDLDNPDVYISFDYDTEKTNVLFYGFNYMSWDSEEGWAKAGSYIPKSFNPDFGKHRMYIIALNGDIDNISISTVYGYINELFDQRIPTEAFTVIKNSFDSTLGEVISDIISEDNYMNHNRDDYEETVRDIISDEEYLGYVAEFMFAHGQLSETPAERYDRGRLDDIISETAYVSRVLYVTFDVTVPAGESIVIGAETLREASYDFVGSRSSENLEGFDLVTKIGTNIIFEEQRASVSDTEYIDIVYNNFGFDIEGGITEVILGEEEHYWMEIAFKGAES